MNYNYNVTTFKYQSLCKPYNSIHLRYIWLDGNGRDLRTKTIRVTIEPKTLQEVPYCAYCGQTCGHMKLTANSDCWLKPVLLCSDPFRGDNNKLIFCAPIKYQIEASINRHSCDKIVNQLSESQQSVSQFIVKQPYFLVDKLTKRAIGWPFDTFDELNVSANYAVGANRAVGRDIDEAFYRASLYAGLPISASNVEDLPSMWSFELGPTPGTNIGDQLWMARYLLQYIGEQFGFVISFEPLRHIQSKHQFIQLWTTEKCCEKQLFAMNSDPYIAIKEICLAKLS